MKEFLSSPWTIQIVGAVVASVVSSLILNAMHQKTRSFDSKSRLLIPLCACIAWVIGATLIDHAMPGISRQLALPRAFSLQFSLLALLNLAIIVVVIKIAAS